MQKTKSNKYWNDLEEKKTICVEISGKDLINFENYFTIGAICDKHDEMGEQMPLCKDCKEKEKIMIKEMQAIIKNIWEKYVEQFEFEEEQFFLTEK
jgi:hypothetical protein